MSWKCVSDYIYINLLYFRTEFSRCHLDDVDGTGVSPVSRVDVIAPNQQLFRILDQSGGDIQCEFKTIFLFASMKRLSKNK